ESQIWYNSKQQTFRRLQLGYPKKQKPNPGEKNKRNNFPIGSFSKSKERISIRFFFDCLNQKSHPKEIHQDCFHYNFHSAHSQHLHAGPAGEGCRFYPECGIISIYACDID
ncbi:MAG: hypothetical protein Q8M12_05150, partial [bacterium]|nr:hypothetical protein [bacterium]